MGNNIRHQALHQQLDTVIHPIVAEGGYRLPLMLAFQFCITSALDMIFPELVPF